MASNGDQTPNATASSKPSATASCTPITLDDDQSPPISVDPSVLPLTTRHTSKAWDHFKRKKIGDDIKAECNYCLKLLAGGPKSGTSHLAEHTKKCPKRRCLDLRQTRLFGSQSNLCDKGETLTLAPYEFHQEQGRKDLAEMIILHEYPLGMVEHYGFRKYSKTLQPGFKVPCRNTTKKDIFQRYEKEKESISLLLRKSKSRVALTTDMWSATNQNKGYMALTAHFVDGAWKLQSRILRFIYVPAPHTAEVLAEFLKECIHSWNLDLRLSSITVDNCSTNDAMMEILRNEFPYGSLMLNGRFIHMRCCAHILNLIVQDGLSTVFKDGLERIRESVVFWTASSKRVQKFEQVAKQLVPECGKKLILDCKTRWNSTFEMLNVARNFREVFVVLSARNNLYKNPPLSEDWDKVDNICEILEVFSNATLEFSASKYPTANIYFPIICNIKIALTKWLSSPIYYMRTMVQVMIEKYNKYWVDVNGLMGVATVLDPRFKMKLIRFYFSKIYDELNVQHEVDKIRKLLIELVDEYGHKNGKNQASSSHSSVVEFSSTQSFMKEYAQYVMEDNDEEEQKSDLDKYLALAPIPLVHDFDVLNWWKTNGRTYPILQQIARDIMSIPVSTVPSESAFSTSGRVLDPYRSRLLPQTIEALMCAQNWIWADIKGSGEWRDMEKDMEDLEDESECDVTGVTCID